MKVGLSAFVEDGLNKFKVLGDHTGRANSTLSWRKCWKYFTTWKLMDDVFFKIVFSGLFTYAEQKLCFWSIKFVCWLSC